MDSRLSAAIALALCGVMDRVWVDCWWLTDNGVTARCSKAKVHSRQSQTSSRTGPWGREAISWAAGDRHTMSLQQRTATQQGCMLVVAPLVGRLCRAHTCRRFLSSQDSCTEHTTNKYKHLSIPGTLRVGMHEFPLAKPRNPQKGVTLAHCGATPHKPADKPLLHMTRKE